MAKNNKSKGSISNGENSNDKMVCNVAISGGKRGRGSSNEESSLELGKKPNKIMMKPNFGEKRMSEGVDAKDKRKDIGVERSEATTSKDEHSGRTEFVKKQFKSRSVKKMFLNMN